MAANVAEVARSFVKQKISVRLQPELLGITREAVELGLAISTSDFIEEAIRMRSREVRHARLRRLAKEALSDPAFVADMHETMNWFGTSDVVPPE